jgi:hypothetical protein
MIYAYNTDQRLLPLAFAAVNEETTHNWGWFMNWLWTKMVEAGENSYFILTPSNQNCVWTTQLRTVWGRSRLSIMFKAYCTKMCTNIIKIKELKFYFKMASSLKKHWCHAFIYTFWSLIVSKIKAKLLISCLIPLHIMFVLFRFDFALTSFIFQKFHAKELTNLC